MKDTIFYSIIFIFFLSCEQKFSKSEPEILRITTQKLHNRTATVDIPEYFLITDSLHPRKQDAEEILEIKRKWPLAMQSLNTQEFEDILSQNFVFADHGKMMQRKAYIANRTTPSDWKITHVKYDNLTLQFFDDSAILSYRNHVTNKNFKTKETEIEDISWVDVYQKEQGKWKIAASHVIDFKMTPISK